MKVAARSDTKTTSSNLTDQQMLKAMKTYDKLSIFKGISHDARQIKPLVTLKLDRKERAREREMTAGKNWGHMPKVELTEEIKADLRALKLRTHIFAKRFYKTNDSDKLP